MWLNANDRKVNVYAILDYGSYETFLNEEISGVLGLRGRYQTVTVNVLNNEVEQFQSMPLDVTIESPGEEFRKQIKTCPKRVTGNYKVDNWKKSRDGRESGLTLENVTFRNQLKMDLRIC